MKVMDPLPWKKIAYTQIICIQLQGHPYLLKLKLRISGLSKLYRGKKKKKVIQLIDNISNLLWLKHFKLLDGGPNKQSVTMLSALLDIKTSK